MSIRKQSAGPSTTFRLNKEGLAEVKTLMDDQKTTLFEVIQYLLTLREYVIPKSPRWGRIVANLPSLEQLRADTIKGNQSSVDKLCAGLVQFSPQDDQLCQPEMSMEDLKRKLLEPATVTAGGDASSDIVSNDLPLDVRNNSPSSISAH